MRDEYDARMWAEHHQAFTTQIVDLIDKLRQVFELLRDYQYHAPWDRQEKAAVRCEQRCIP